MQIALAPGTAKDLNIVRHRADPVVETLKPGIIPAKNGGYLTPGNPGNKGGGPIPQAVRQAALNGIADAIPVYTEIVNGGDDYTPLEKIAAGRELKDISGVHRETTIIVSNAEAMQKWGLTLTRALLEYLAVPDSLREGDPEAVAEMVAKLDNLLPWLRTLGPEMEASLRELAEQG